MVLTKDELIGSLKDEIRILLHLVSKADPKQLDYRASEKQRSTLELLQYLTIVGPIHLRTIASGAFSMDEFGNMWSTEGKAAASRGLEETRQEIGTLAAMFSEVIGAMSDEDLRAPIEMFGQKGESRALDRPAGSQPLCRLSDAAVSLSQSEWP